MLEGIAAGEHTERSLILDLALALSEDRRRDIVRRTEDGLEAARRRGRVGGRRPVVGDDERAAILARRKRGESIRTIAAGVKVSVGVVHRTLADAQLAATEGATPADQPDHPEERRAAAPDPGRRPARTGCVAHRSLAGRPVALASLGEALELPFVHVAHPLPARLGRWADP